MRRIFITLFFAVFFLVGGFVSFVSAITEEEEEIWLDEDEEIKEGQGPALDSSDLKSPPTDDSLNEPALTDRAEGEEPSNQEINNSLEDEGSDLSSPTQESPPPATVEAMAQADEYEQNLYETYTKYYSKKVSVEEWNNIAGNKDTYTIQEKDTLWDISKMLFDDSHYWPKLWSVNPSLGNPHLIQPQDILGFVHGTEGGPPYLTMVQKGGKGGVAGVAGPKTLTGDVPKPVINIPSSLPPLRLSQKKKQKTDWDISVSALEIGGTSFLPYYMTSEPLSVVGKVSDKKDYGTWFSVGQFVLLEMRESVNPGQKLTVINDMGKLYSSTLGVRGPFGYQQQVQGEVEIVGRVPDSFDLYEAKVTKSLNPLSLKAFVVRQGLIEFNHQPTDRTGTGSAQIIGVPTLFENEKKIASPSDFVYLNRGRGSGLSTGQMYQVTANLAVSTRGKRYGYDIKVGELKIVHAEERFATALITSMQNPIYVGDYIHPLSKGLSKERNYDPFEDDDKELIEDPSDTKAGGDDFSRFEEAGEAQEITQKEPTEESAIEIDPDEEDVFEAFE